MRIAIITYQVAHQKTQDVLSSLFLKGYQNIDLYALPFTPRKTRPVKYIHRFNNPSPITPEEIAKNANLGYFPCPADEFNQYFSDNKYDHILIAGAGLLPTELALNHKIINSHPGFLPKVKGLDSLKWAILNDIPELGVTTHYISDKADEGLLIEKKIIPLYKEDSFHSFALRQYTTEIEMLSNSISLIHQQEPSVSLADDTYEATMRMPLRLEDEMIKKFEERRLNAPSIWE